MTHISSDSKQEDERRSIRIPTILFAVLVIVLALANLGVYFYKPLQEAIVGSQRAAILSELLARKDKLINLLSEACSSPNFVRFRRGQFGSNPSGADESKALPQSKSVPPTDLSISPEKSPSSTAVIPSSEKFRKLLVNQTVRVIAGKKSGSGFFIDKNLVVTNRHVIEGIGQGEVFVTNQTFAEGPIRARIIAATVKSDFARPDFAVLQLERTPLSVVVAKIAKTPSALDEVFAVGFPGKTIVTDENSVTPSTVLSSGKVTVIQKRNDGAILVIHTADIARGSSGGPLVNKCGQIVGVNTFINSNTGPDGRALYALSSETLINFLKATKSPFTEVDRACEQKNMKK